MSLLPFSRATFGNNPAGEMDMFGLSDPMFGMTEYGWPANTGMMNKHIGQHNLMMDVVELGDSFKVYAGNKLYMSLLPYSDNCPLSLIRCARC
jgi:hypothetical protein